MSSGLFYSVADAEVIYNAMYESLPSNLTILEPRGPAQGGVTISDIRQGHNGPHIPFISIQQGTSGYDNTYHFDLWAQKN